MRESVGRIEQPIIENKNIVFQFMEEHNPIPVFIITILVAMAIEDCHLGVRSFGYYPNTRLQNLSMGRPAENNLIISGIFSTREQNRHLLSFFTES